MTGIEDVARLAGVSTATVSRALSGKNNVSDRAQAKVNAAANELGYVASHSAYTLATGRNRNIGVVMPSLDRWFFSAILEAAETSLIEHGYDLTLYNLSGGPAQRAKIFNEFLLRKRVDAVLTVAVAPSSSELDNLNKMKKPILGIGGPIPGARALWMNDVKAGRLATDHLISLGHTRIGHLGGTPAAQMEFQQPRLRQVGYNEALAAAGLEARPSWFLQAELTLESGYHQAKQMLGNPEAAPTALFCASDEMAFGAIMAAKDLGLRVPQDVSIVGIDNHDLSEFYGLTTISQNVRAQGREAAETLIKLLSGPDISDEPNIEINTEWPIELVVRSSTARPASAN